MHYSFKSSKKYPSSLKGMYLLLLFKQPVTSRDKTWNSSDNIYKFIKKKKKTFASSITYNIIRGKKIIYTDRLAAKCII